MIETTINQVEYSVGNEESVIHIFGRTKDGEAKRIDICGFRPYFYVAAEEAETLKRPVSITDEEFGFVSIKGDELTRLYTKTPFDIKEVREKYHHFEADLSFSTRFMIDSGLTGGILVPSETCDYSDIQKSSIDSPARVCIIDIECDDSHGFPDSARDAIICLTCYDSFDRKYTTFVFSPNYKEACSKLSSARSLPNGCFDSAFHEVKIYDTESAMLDGLGQYIQTNDPDVLTGWNYTEFDMPYLTGRMAALGLPPYVFSRFQGQIEKNPARGRAIFDLLAGYKKMHLTQKDSYRLDAIAMAELGEQKVRYTGTLWDLCKNAPEALVEYNFKDVELCVKLNEKDEIIDFYRELARYVGMPMDKTLNSSSVVDIFILRKAHGICVLPSKSKSDSGEKFEGATVFPPRQGISKNVIVLDLKSLYPMAMMTINASPETKHPQGELRAPNGVRFKKTPDGLVRSIQSELLAGRDAEKARRNTFAFGSRDYKLCDMRQNVLKIIMNTYYGVSGYSGFRLFDKEIGAAITSVGRAILEHTRNVLESQGYQVIYGDTDACLVSLPEDLSKEETIAIAKKLEKMLNLSYQEFAEKTLNAEKHYFSTKFEKLYERFFSGGKKKRYAGLLTWKEGKDVNEVDIVGFEIRRSDSPKITKEVQGKLMTMILAGEEYTAIQEYIKTVVRKYRSGGYPLDIIGIPGGIGKNLDDYDTDDAQVRGAKYSNLHLHTNFGKGSKPMRIYVKSCGSYRATNVVCFEYADQVPADFVVDRELMLEKTIQQPLSRILESLGWNWMDFDPTITTLASWGFG